MTPTEIDKRLIPAALEAMNLPSSLELRVQMLSICGQESGWEKRYQVLDGGGKGPARGLWQFERGGGVKGVFEHHTTHEHLRLLCRARDVAFDVMQIWMALEHDDVLAAGCARLLLLADPAPLPALGNQAGAWAYYLRCWRPGKPHPKRWPANYTAAMKAVV